MSRRLRGFVPALAAVLAGNALYFSLLSRLPVAWQHQPFRADIGLLLDALLCALFFFMFRRLAD